MILSPNIQLTNDGLKSFYRHNPDFNILSYDLHDAQSLARLNWSGESQADILALLKSYQRLLKLYPNEQGAELLQARGFTSAQQIARVPEQRFVREMGPALNSSDGDTDGARLALSIHRNARAVQTGTMLLALDGQLASQAASIPSLSHLQDLIPFHQGMPSYERLFGRNAYAVDKDAQTIFSPAAYFVDLMNLIDQYITQANADTIPAGLSLQERRPDLWQIELDADSTYTELPYIEIINQILETKLRYDLGEDPRQYIANAVYPFKLPANLPLAEIRAYLNPFKLTLAGIYQAYRVAEQQVARESLGLSLESYGLISGNPSLLPDGTTPTVSDFYGLYESQTTDDLSYQKLFLERTGLTSQQLNDLIYQDIRATSSKPVALSFDGSDDYVQSSLNSALMHGLFINSALADNQYLCLTPPGRIQVTDGATIQSNPDDATLDRLQSFVRLANQLDWAYADLDWTLRSLGATAVDNTAMEGIALVKQIQEQLQQPLDVLCSLWADMKTIGQGAQAGPPQDLFDRVFNLPDAFYDPGGRQRSVPYHPLYSGNPLYQDSVQSWSVDSTSDDPTYATDTQFRSRLMAALQLNDGDLTKLAHYLCDQDLLVATDLNGAAQNAAEYTIGLTVQNLTLLYRYSELAQLLKLSVSDFLTLLPLIGQPAIASAQDMLKVCEWALWLKRAGLPVPQLSYITTGELPRSVDQSAAGKAVAGMLKALAASRHGVMVTPAALLTSGMSQAQAQALFDNLVTQGFISSGGLVLHERPLSYQSLAALMPDQTGDSSLVGLSPHETSPVQPPTAEDVKEKVGLHVEAVLRAYLARQNLLVTKALANSFRATPAQMESAAQLTELMQPSSLIFNGTDDYCEVSYASALNPSVFTVSCWVKVAEQTSNWQSIITSRWADEDYGGYIIYVTPTDPSGQGFSFWIGDGSQWLQLTDYTPIVDEWTHIAVAYDGAYMNLYLNGKPSASGSLACSDFVPNTKYNLRIGTGCTEGPPLLYFGGEIGDMRLWQTALTAEQVQAEMYREPQNTSDLVAWWPIKAGSGSTLYDWSLNDHDGPLYEYINGTPGELSAPDWQNYHLNQLLNPLQPGAALPQEVLDFLTLAAQNLTLIKALNLTSYEVAALVRNPAPFGINGIGPGFAFTPEQVRTIWEFKQLCKAFNDTSNQLLAYFAAPTSAALAQITGWNEDQITTLEGYLGALGTELITSFDSVAGVAALKRCFDVSLTLGVSIDYVLNTLLLLNDLPVLGAAGVDNWTLYETTAASVKQVLLKHYSPDLLQTALASLQGPLQEQLRDCLSRLLIWELGETFAGIKTEQDLYEFLLTDVQTSSVVQLSYLKEGLNALQLYVQRCLTNLENGVTNTIPRAWWAWMDSYRVWQANREVYLYPENYVDPTLRKMQSSQFRDFSTQLMQGQLTEKLMAESYANYMDAVQELANLRIIESYAVDLEQVLPVTEQQQAEQKLLYLFGCTRTDPSTYYIRTALINEAGKSIPVWTPWEQINLNINADYVTPVYAFNRLFLFWVEQAKQTVNADPLNSSAGSIEVTTATIKYSFRKMGWGWVQPQTLRDKIVINIDPPTAYQQSWQYTLAIDPDKLSWEKVVAMTIPYASHEQEEELLISYGPLISGPRTKSAAPAPTNNPFVDEFNQMLYRALQTGYENTGNYVPLGPAMIVAGNLARRDTKLAVGSENSYTWSGLVDRSGVSTSQLNYVKFDVVRSLFEVPAFPTNLINYWPMHEGGSGGSVQSIADVAGTETLEVKGSLTWDTAVYSPSGQELPVIYFDGVTTALYGDEGLTFPNNYSEITIEAWVWLSNSTNNQKIVVISQGQGYTVGYSLGVQNGNIYFEIFDAGINLNNGSVPEQQWVHLAFTAKSNGTAYGYVNGVVQDSASLNQTLSDSSDVSQLNQLYIGSEYNGGGFFVQGCVCDARLWNQQLSDGQIQALYREPINNRVINWSSLGLNAIQSIGLLSNSISPLATARPVGNQIGWFIFDNTDEVFLATPEQAGLPSASGIADFDMSTPGLIKLSFTNCDPVETTNLELSFTRLSTHGVLTLSRLLLTGGVHMLLSLPAQHARELSFDRFSPSSYVNSDAVSKQIDFAGAFGEYFWEIFFFMPLLAANSFNARQQFTYAKKWYEFIFNPTQSLADNIADEKATAALIQAAPDSGQLLESDSDTVAARRKRFWRFVPFRQAQRQSLYQNLTDPTQILIYEYDPFDPDAIAHQRIGAYEKSVVMKYIKNLINYGDYLFTQDTWETLTEATMYYVLADDLMGKPPKVIVSDRNQTPATYQELAALNAGAPPFLIDLEPQVDITTIYPSAPPQVRDLLQNWGTLYDAYFKVPGNSQLLNYYKTIEDRLYKIRNGLNIEGQPVEPPLFEPPINPETLVTGGAQSWAGNGSASPVALAASIPAYRFSYLIQQAKGLASVTSSLGASLLAALEKQDAEHLALMQATQQNNIFNLTTQIKQSQVNQLQAVNDRLQASLASAQLQQSTYREWLAGGLSAWEIGSESLLLAAMPFEIFAYLFEALSAGAFVALPDDLQLADKAGNALKNTSAMFSLLGAMSMQSSQLLGMQGQFERRSDDWNLQMQIAANSVQQIDAQLQANQYELDAAQQDLSINQTNIEQSQQIIDFLNSKFTNQELYQWMAGQLSTLYYQAYQLACQMGLSAQTAYQYELCNSDTFINTNAWNSQYQGLLAGDNLLSNLDQMEQSYLNNNTRKLEITKTISLLKLAPQALLRLKQSGQCKFTLSELLFDLDYPGHYQRTIETISISIPAVVGPYQNVHATLTQLSNALVTTPNLEGIKYLLGLTGTANGSVRMNWNPSQEVALSTGIDDSGLFQLNFNDERYLPFEGTGAVSEWQLSMPKASNPINFESISDVIITLRYSAYDGGQAFAQSVIKLNDGQGYYPLKDYKGYKYLSLKQVYSNGWHAFLNGYEGVYTLDFVLVSEMFPLNLNGTALGQGANQQVFLAPVFAQTILNDSNFKMPDITLNSNPWSQGLVDATSQSSGTEGSGPFPLNWRIQANITDPSPLLRHDGQINPVLWQDIVLVIPYSGSLDWGND